MLIKLFKKIPKHSILLIGIILFVFIFPLFENGSLKNLLVSLSYTVMLLSVGSIIENKTRWLFYMVFIAVILQWVSYFIEHRSFPLLTYMSFSFSLMVFLTAIYMMISQIIISKKVDARLIVETITGYLLIGVSFTLINILLGVYSPESIGFPSGNISVGDYIYYSFITFTTIGYGDISPVSQAARSFAILFGLIGQLYLTIIIAFIIGKYLNSKN